MSTVKHPQAPGEGPSRGDRNRSLERGIEILRAFKPGADLLGNGELAERTGLSRATVSRLAQTLVDSGMLEHDRRRRAYRLAAPVLSLAHAMRSGSPVLQIADPWMRKEAEQRKINVGLAVADRDEMVYLESVRYSRRVSWRNVVAGQRVPMELTSLGRAWLAAAPDEQRRSLMDQFRKRRSSGWRELAREISAAIDSVHRARLLLGVVAATGGGAGHTGGCRRPPCVRAEHEHHRRCRAAASGRTPARTLAKPGAALARINHASVKRGPDRRHFSTHALDRPARSTPPRARSGAGCRSRRAPRCLAASCSRCAA